MRSSKNRSRSKSNRQRSIGNIINRVFDSSGPESKVRGTPQQIIEKYLMLARDAQLSNDRVAEQNFLQHAEHYTRMLGEAQAELAREQATRQPQGGGDRQPYSGGRDRDDLPPATSGSYGDPAGHYEADEAGIVETPEMRARADNDQRREPRRDQNGNRGDGQRNDGQRDRNQPRNDAPRDQNRNDQNRAEQYRNEPGRNDQNRSDQYRNDAPRPEPVVRAEPAHSDQPRQDRPRREPRAPRPQTAEAAEPAGADIPLPAFVAEPLRLVETGPSADGGDKPKPRRRTAKPVATDAAAEASVPVDSDGTSGE